MRQERFSFLSVGLIVVLAVAFFAGLVWLNYLLVPSLPGGESLFNTWYGVQGFLFDRFDPYEAQTAIQAGREFGSASDFPRLDLPLSMLLLNAPIAAQRDFALARALWNALAEIALVVMAFVNLRLVGWRPNRVLLAIYLLFSLFSVHVVLPWLAGTPVIWMALLFTLALWALRQENDELAGALLALTTFNWQSSGLFLFFVLLWVMTQKRQRVLAGFGMALVILWTLSFMFWSDWFLPFVRASVANWREGFGSTSADVFRARWPGVAVTLGWLLTLGFSLILIFEWQVARRKGFRHFLWAASLTLAVTPLIGLPTDFNNYLLLFLPLSLFLSIGSERWMRSWGGGVILGGLLVGLWLLLWRAVTGHSSLQDALFFPLPVITIIGLYWVRWWAVRAPVVRPGSVLDEEM